MPTAEQQKAFIRRYFAEVVSKGNLQLIPDLVAPNIVFWGPYTSEPIHGIKGFTELIAMLHAAFDDLRITENEMIVEGDTVATRWAVSGIHRGEFMGTGPSGEPFQFTGTAFYRLAEGKIIEAWSFNNSLEVLSRHGQAASAGTNVAATRRAQLQAVAEAYFGALMKKDFAAIPYADDVSLRAPLCPGGVLTPLVGKEALHTIWWPPIAASVGEVKVLDHYINTDLTAVCTEAVIDIIDPPATLRVADRFTVNAEGKITEQETHFDPRDVTTPGWRKT